MKAAGAFTPLRNGASVAWDSVPRRPWDAFAEELRGRLAAGCRASAYFCAGSGRSGGALVALLADDARGLVWAGRTHVRGAFPSLAAEFPQLERFELEIREQCGLDPVGHPDPGPVRGTAGPGAGPALEGRPYRVEGEGVHEVAVGPIHAGVIEPGRFRFQCDGETVLHLGIFLGYQHRGVERALAGGPGPRSPHIAETLAGDTTIGHALAYSAALEALAGARPPARGMALGALALELERLANHVGDLGALSGDAGFLPTAAYCGRLRGDFLNMTALLCGNRFGRGWVRPGGTTADADAARLRELGLRLDAAERDLAGALALLRGSASVQARFRGPGRLESGEARALGMVGPAARACGLDRDLRRDHPLGQYRIRPMAPSVHPDGDVWARTEVRRLEAEASLRYVRELSRAMPEGPVRRAPGPPRPRRLAVALVEGWRGELCHAALTDGRGRLLRYKVVDASFHNWPGVALAMRGGQLSDFPLCNKSFGLSYCGHDL